MQAGLRDNVPDFRKCVRTIELDTLPGFIRWNMHYRIEHHVFAAGPCYDLGRCYRAEAADMPKRRTIIGAWKEMREIERRQKTEPGNSICRFLKFQYEGREQDPHRRNWRHTAERLLGVTPEAASRSGPLDVGTNIRRNRLRALYRKI